MILKVELGIEMLVINKLTRVNLLDTVCMVKRSHIQICSQYYDY